MPSLEDSVWQFDQAVALLVAMSIELYAAAQRADLTEDQRTQISKRLNAVTIRRGVYDDWTYINGVDD